MKADFHMHTNFSSDATYSLEEMIEGAIKKGLKTICITDHDQVIAAAGYGKKELQDKYISKRLESVISDREQVLAYQGEKKFVPVTEETQDTFAGQIISPVICEGDVLGSVVLLEKQEKQKLGETEQKVVTCASNFLGRQMEQ